MAKKKKKKDKNNNKFEYSNEIIGVIIILIGIIGATPILKKIVQAEKVCKVANALEPVFLLAILAICTGYIVDGSFNPFLYFRF